MAVDSLGYGEVWSDAERPIVHFGSPAPKRITLVDSKGNPIEA